MLHLGSNMGDRKSNILNALDQIAILVGKIVMKSSIYLTEAWGKEDQEDFYNLAVEVNTDLKPLDVLEKTQQIETDLKRERIEKWGPRTIDIDILYYDNIIMNHKDLTLPHPHLAKRNFVLIPLMEIAPFAEHPETKETTIDLYLKSTDQGEVYLIDNE